MLKDILQDNKWTLLYLTYSMNSSVSKSNLSQKVSIILACIIRYAFETNDLGFAFERPYEFYVLANSFQIVAMFTWTKSADVRMTKYYTELLNVTLNLVCCFIHFNTVLIIPNFDVFVGHFIYIYIYIYIQ